MVAVSYQLHSLLVARLGALAEFQQRLAALQHQAEVLGKELLDSAPAQVREFLENEMIIENLIRYGQSSTKIISSMANGPAVVAQMRHLAHAWVENVRVKVYPADGHRIEVAFTARNPFA